MILPIVIILQLTILNEALSQSDIARGKKVFNKCKACHSLKKAKHKIGPSLYGLLGRKAGSETGYKRYKGLKGADWVWTENELMEYLADPKKYVKRKTGKRSSMILKLKKERDRTNVIGYLKSIK
ncbi:MAG: c-type cytochrome [Pseudomonadota bacterium]|nr:c-type cytochrome [Pseudomonadota bacterium]